MVIAGNLFVSPLCFHFGPGNVVLSHPWSTRKLEQVNWLTEEIQDEDLRRLWQLSSIITLIPNLPGNSTVMIVFVRRPLGPRPSQGAR